MSFGPTRALEDVSLDLFGGEIRGFIGENGSGKSTLSNVVAGLLKADSGVMELFGKHYAPHSMLDADKNKVSMIVQEMATINKISVAANIFAGKETQFGKFGMINKKAMNKAAQAALERIGVTWITLLYLGRRAEENCDVLGNAKTEMALLRKELRRRLLFRK